MGGYEYGKPNGRWKPGMTELECARCKQIRPKDDYRLRGLVRETTCKHCKDTDRKRRYRETHS